MYPYYKEDIDKGVITREFAQELIDCIWVKMNDLNKCRDEESAKGFAGYSLFQNLIVGGQNKYGEDVTNDLSFMCIEASKQVFLPQPSLSIRVWNGSPHELLMKAADLTRTGIGLPAYYNDEVIIPALQNRGLTLEDAREYNIIGCVEPQKSGKTNGWHDAAFFNMCRPLELVFANGMDKGVQVGIQTGDVTKMNTFDEFYDAYKKQMEYCISLMVNADNAIDVAHAERCPLPFLASMVDDCLTRGLTAEQGGAVYTLPVRRDLVLRIWQIPCMRSASLFMKIRKFPWRLIKKHSHGTTTKALMKICCRYVRNDSQGNAGCRNDCQRRYSKSSSSDSYETETFR